jgi:thioredoxin-related protein
MRRIFCAFLLMWCTALAAASPSPESAVLAPGMVNPGYHEPPPWFKNSFLDLRVDVREAATAGRRVLLYFYQDGCPYCKKLLEDNLGQREIGRQVRQAYDVVAVNIWGDREVVDLEGQATTEKEFAGHISVMFTPTLLFLDEAGASVLRINGYYPPHQFLAAVRFAAPGQTPGVSFRDYLARQNPVPAQGILHTEPYFMSPPLDFSLLAGRGKPLLVLFEQKQCAACDELHADVLARAGTKTLMEKFDVAQLDMWSRTPVITPAGRRTTAASWASDLGVEYAPTLVFFDAAGTEVFRAGAYLKSFHLQSVLDYVASGAYRAQPSLQRFIQARADAMRAQGIEVDLLN